jgi:hypothetical protein
MQHNTSPTMQLDLVNSTRAAIMEDSIRDSTGTGEIKKNIELATTLGSVAVEPDDLLPKLIPEIPIEHFDQEREDQERIKNEHQQNVNLMFRLANLLPSANYKLNNSLRGETDVAIDPQTDPYLAAAVKESIIWVKSAYGSIPYVCYGSKAVGRKTQLLLINLKPESHSTKKWAKWSMVKVDLSGTASIPLRDSGLCKYDDHEVISGKISTKKWNEFQETLPSRIHKRWLADKDYYSSSYLNRSEDPIRFDENSFDVSMPLDFNTPWIDNDCAKKFEIAEHMAATAAIFNVSEAFNTICERIDSES